MSSITESLVTLALFTGSLIPGLLIGCLIALFFYLKFRKPPQIDLMKRMFEEMVEEAVINRSPNMLLLERAAIPSMLDLKEAGVDPEKMEKYTKAVENKRGGNTILGGIVGHVSFDLLATIQDLMLEFNEKPKVEDLSGMSEAQQEAYKMANSARLEKLKEYKEVLTMAGQNLHFFVYETKEKARLIGTKTVRRGVFAFQDQIFGLGSDDGVVTLAGDGTARLAVYFQVLTGYPSRLDLVTTHLVSYSRIYTGLLLVSNEAEYLMRAMGGDTDFMKMMKMAQAGGNMRMGGNQGSNQPMQMYPMMPQQEQKSRFRR